MTYIKSIIEGNFLLLIIILPLIYFLIRDGLGALRAKTEQKKHTEAMIEAEKRIYALMKESDKHNEELIQNIRSLKESIDGSTDFIQSKLDDEKNKQS